MVHRTIVIGAGHNGLAAAKTLATAGHTVTVLEQADRPGGMAANADIAPGFTAPRMAHLLYGMDKADISHLRSHGLSFAAEDIPTVVLAPDRQPLVLRGNDVEFVDGARHPDAAAYGVLRKRMIRFAGKLAMLMRKPPAPLEGGSWRDAATMAGLALAVRRMGAADAREFLRVLLSNAYDTILDEIDDGPLAAALGLDAVLGGHAGPRAPGTVLTLMYRLTAGGVRRMPRGGMGAAMEAFQTAAEAAGAEVRLGAGVEKILVENDKTVGVLLTDGARLDADRVLSSLDPMTTLKLTGVAHFDAEMVRRIRNFRAKGCAAKVNLALSAQPNFAGIPAALHGARIVVAPSLDGLEIAFNGAKYGELPLDPVLEITVPSIADPSLAPSGGHVLSAVVQYVPHGLKQGWSDTTRNALGDIVVAALDRIAPGIADTIVARDVLSPVDIEGLTGATGGHWHHGEMITDQMLMLRPAPGIDQYALPVDGLFLCGSSTHPGGDVTAAPGVTAARAVLSRTDRRNAA